MQEDSRCNVLKSATLFYKRLHDNKEGNIYYRHRYNFNEGGAVQ